MNAPTKLTLFRIFLTPIFLLFMLWRFPFHYLVAGAIFILAIVTDRLDGSLARKSGEVTDMGKFLDPLADKILTTAAFLAFLVEGRMSVWAVALILSREFTVTSVRLAAAKKDVVIAAGLFGKVKTVAQYVAVLLNIFAMEFSDWRSSLLAGAGLPDAAFTVPLTVGYVALWIAAVLTVCSGVQYVYNGRKFFTD